MAAPRFHSVNVVIGDVAATAAFLRELGVEVRGFTPEWDAHHQSIDDSSPDVDLDLDSAAFAKWWGGVTADVPQVVVNLHIDSREGVDDIHARALAAGAQELKAPWDAFWGARYSVVLAPGPCCIGFMSDMDEANRNAGPEVSDFA